MTSSDEKRALTAEITPYEGVGNIRFGMSLSECEGILSSRDASSFRRTPEAEETVAFDEIGVQLSFSESGKLELIEAHSPSVISYRGIPLLGRAATEVEDDLKEAGARGSASDAGVDYLDDGFALYSPGGRVEAVSVFVRGYYDD